jgi:hypothetical protein
VDERAVKQTRVHQAGGIIAWQGWELHVPAAWNPVRLEGDWDSGQALLVDMERPRLGLRWQKPRRGKEFDAETAVKKAMRDEVGRLAADEARPFEMADEDWQASLLYVEPEPPGRDVWIGYSRRSGRMLQAVYHAKRRESTLAERVLSSVTDSDRDAETRWSVFELSCVAPAAMKLTDQKLMAGDLSLTFASKGKTLTVRQVAVAELALKRMSLEKWVGSQQRVDLKHYRPLGKVEEIAIDATGREIRGVIRRSVRRRRFCWVRGLVSEKVTCALHDEARDRLVIVEANEKEALKVAAGSVGWAKAREE